MDTRIALELDGELTAPQANAQRERLLGWVEQASPCAGQRMQLDLAAVAEMDTAGAQLLIALSRHLQALGALLDIVNPSYAVTGVLATYRLLPALGLQDAQGGRA